MEYMKNTRILRIRENDIYEMERIQDFLVKNKISCVKYNSTIILERANQCYDAFIQLSPDKKRLLVTKKIVIDDYEAQ
jgi:hypothetical protein